MKEALGDLKEQGAQRLVLDIRNNGGGLFPAGVEIARLFIPK
jgi:carboxyl-terminal processing protease